MNRSSIQQILTLATGMVLSSSAVAPFRPGAPKPCDDLAHTLGGNAGSSGSVCKVSLPRRDLRVTLLGAQLPPGMGLTSWAAFLPVAGGRDMVMGDLVLAADELGPVQRGLLDQGFTITAVHHHMLDEEPTLTFVHYLGRGPATQLAQALRAALGRAPTALGLAAPEPDAAPAAADMPCGRIEQGMGVKPGSAETGPGFCKITVPRPDYEVRLQGIAIPAAMGVSSWFAFKQTLDGEGTVVAGDIAVRPEQLGAALAVLAHGNVRVVVVHNHMLFDEPRVVFFHFEARGYAEALAKDLRGALDAAMKTRQ